MSSSIIDVSLICAQVRSGDSESEDDEYSDVYEVLGSKKTKIIMEETQSAATPSPAPRRERPTGGRGNSRQNGRMSVIMSPDMVPELAPHVPASTRRPQPLKKYSIDDFQLLKVLGKGSFGKVCDTNVMSLEAASEYCFICDKTAMFDTWKHFTVFVILFSALYDVTFSAMWKPF